MFGFCNTVKVYYEKASFDNLVGYLKSHNFKRILLLTGTKSSAKVANEIKITLGDFEVCYIDGIVSNPLDSKVCEIAASAKEFDADVILTVGGGSVHDTGKAVAVMYYDNDGNSVDDYTVTGKLSVPGIKKVLPVITVSTLIGSGAEVSPAALIRVGSEKKVIFSPLLHPDACFFYESVLSGIPTRILARSMYDSFIQALEGYISTKANALSRTFSLEAMRYVINNVDMLKNDTKDEPNYEELAVASVLSSYVASVASVGAIHALSDPLSGIYDIHHADALGLVTIPVLEKNLPDTQADLAEVLKLFGVYVVSKNQKVVRKHLIEQINILRQALISVDLKKELNDEELTALVNGSFNPDMDGNPHEFNKDEVKEIFEEIF